MCAYYIPLCGCVAELVRRWLRRVAIGRFALPMASRSVCGSEDHEFEPRFGYGSYVFMTSTKGLHYYTLKTVTRRTLRVCPPRYGCMTVNCEAKLVPLPFTFVSTTLP